LPLANRASNKPNRASVCYRLSANKIIGENVEISAKTLPCVQMPNRDGFDWIDVKK
jgi:hypothetical protein